jgi:hypothetical protein
LRENVSSARLTDRFKPFEIDGYRAT